jgi:hypothetical protein
MLEVPAMTNVAVDGEKGRELERLPRESTASGVLTLKSCTAALEDIHTRVVEAVALR